MISLYNPHNYSDDFSLINSIHEKISNSIKQSIIDFDNISGCKDISDEVKYYFLKTKNRF